MANEKRLIDIEDALRRMENAEHLMHSINGIKAVDIGAVRQFFGVLKPVDAVSRGVHDQVRWERDVAIEQLESYGVSFGEKAEVAKVVHGRWISCGCGFDCCSECRKVYTDGYFTAMGIKPREQFNYCPNCGAKMDGDGNDNT